MRFLCAIRIVCWRVSVFYVAAVSAIPADGVPCGGACPARAPARPAAVVPAGGAWRFRSPAYPATVVPAGGACLLCRLPPLPLAFFPAPYPPDPLPRWGRGRFFCFLMQGAPPLAFPALDRLRHLQNLPCRCPEGGYSPCGTCSPCPGGEDHLKRRRRLRRIVPSPPVPPLLGWRHCQ